MLNNNTQHEKIHLNNNVNCNGIADASAKLLFPFSLQEYGAIVIQQPEKGIYRTYDLSLGDPSTYICNTINTLCLP